MLKDFRIGNPHALDYCLPANPPKALYTPPRVRPDAVQQALAAAGDAFETARLGFSLKHIMPSAPVRNTKCLPPSTAHAVILAASKSPFGRMYDLRREVGDAGWLTLQKQVAAAEGKRSVIFSTTTPVPARSTLDEVTQGAAL